MPLNLSPTQLAFNARGDGTFNVPFQEQVDFLKQKLDLPTAHWDDILTSAHDRGFIVAGAAKADLLADFHTAINQAVADGKSIGWFKNQFESIVQKHGWEGWTGSDTAAGRDWRARVIYNTNIRSSYAAGRYAQLTDPDLLQTRPYWKYIHNDTVAHPRPLHQSWNGLVLPHDDPFWSQHFPPNGFGCRCRIAAVRAKDYQGHPAPDDGEYTKIDRNGVAHTLPKGVDYGWGYTPGAGVDTGLRTLVQDKLINYKPAITKALSRDINRYINAHDDIAGFAQRALDNRSITENLWLGFVENSEAILAETKIDTKGFLVLLPADTVPHIDNHHKFDGKGQRPVLPKDFEQVGIVLAEYDQIKQGKVSKTGLFTLVVRKVIGREVFRCVFEVRGSPKNRSIVLTTMSIAT
jgi:hypothetical protein